MLGRAAFVALALLLAGTLRAEGVLAVANLLWVLCSGRRVVLPTDRLPGAWGPSGARCPPGGALGDSRAQRSSTAAGPWAHWAVLVGWGWSGRCWPGACSAGATDRPVTPPPRAAVASSRDEHQHHLSGRPAGRPQRLPLAVRHPDGQPGGRGADRRHRRARPADRQRAGLPHLAAVRRRLGDAPVRRPGRGLPQVHRVRQPHADQRRGHRRAARHRRGLASGLAAPRRC